MQPSIPRQRYLQWVRITCCLIAMGGIPMLCIAAMFGAQVNWTVAPSIAGLGMYVIRRVV